MREQPRRSHDLTPDGEGEVGVHRHQRQGMPMVALEILIAHRTSEAGLDPSFDLRGGEPCPDHSGKDHILRLIPVGALGSSESELVGPREISFTERDQGAVALCHRGGHVVRCVDVLVAEPSPDVLAGPSGMRVPCEQAAKQQSQSVVGQRRDVDAAGDHVQPKRKFVGAVEAPARRRLFQQDHAHRPPIGRRAHRPNDRFRRGVAGEFERGHRLQIEVGQPGRTEIGDH